MKTSIAIFEERLRQVRDRFEEWGVEGVFISSPENRRWLSGFSGSAGSLLVTPDQALLATDFRYWEQAMLVVIFNQVEQLILFLQDQVPTITTSV